MSKTTIDELQILQFFETGPLETAEVVFKIVSHKMRERLGSHRTGSPLAAKEADAARARRQGAVHRAGPDETVSPSPGA